MAKIGLKYPVYKGVTSGVIAKAIEATIAIETSDVTLFADDSIAERDASFTKGTITLGLDDLSASIQNEFLGHAVSSDEITANISDIAPYVGIGFYGKAVKNKVNYWRAIWFPKVQFKEPGDSNKTKGESTEFQTPSIEGTIIQDDNGMWKKEKTFSNEADAIAYLNVLAGIPISASAGLSALSMTGAGGALSPAFGSAFRYYTYGGLTAASVTVTATAASHTIKLYVDGVYTQTLTSATASAAIAMTLGTKKLTIIAQEAGKQSQTTEIIVVKIS